MSIKSAAAAPKLKQPWSFPADRARTIGVVAPCYGSSHVVYGLGTRKYTHCEVMALPLGRFDRTSTVLHHTPLVLDMALPLLHTWNMIPLNRDFIVSHELELPRYLGHPGEAQVRRALTMLASPRCKAILSLSEFARGFAARGFERHGFGQLVDKMRVFRGAVEDPWETMGSRRPRAPRASFAERPFSAALIGTQLFRKGATYAIQAFENLRAKGLNVALTLIGDFEADSYVFLDQLPDPAAWRARARGHDWIDFRGPIPRAEVFPTLAAHDACLYTSLDESLGWLPIEAAMLGMPVIGNRLCAMPELVRHQETGWLVDVPLREDGRWSGLELDGAAGRAAHGEMNARIVAGVEAAVEHLYAHPQDIGRWGDAGRAMMLDLYGVEQAAAALESIYDRALGV